MTILKIFTESNPFKQWRKIWGFRGQEGEWSERSRPVSERFSVFHWLATAAKSCLTLWPPWLHHAWLLCPLHDLPEICSDSCLLGRWCYLTTSSFAVPPGFIINATAVGGALLGYRMALTCSHKMTGQVTQITQHLDIDSIGQSHSESKSQMYDGYSTNVVSSRTVFGWEDLG